MQLSLALASEDWNSVEWRMLVNEVIQSGRGKLIGKHLLKKLLGGDLDEYHRVKNNFVLETSLKNVTRTTRGVLLEAHKVLKKAALSSGVETSNNWAAYVCGHRKFNLGGSAEHPRRTRAGYGAGQVEPFLELGERQGEEEELFQGDCM